MQPGINPLMVNIDIISIKSDYALPILTMVSGGARIFEISTSTDSYVDEIPEIW